LVLVIIGISFILAPKIPFLGKLPGDIFFKKGNFTFYFPIMSSILISIVITIILNLIFRGK
jgi:hypothetical protein